MWQSRAISAPEPPGRERDGVQHLELGGGDAVGPQLDVEAAAEGDEGTLHLAQREALRRDGAREDVPKQTYQLADFTQRALNVYSQKVVGWSISLLIFCLRWHQWKSTRPSGRRASTRG